MKILDFKTLYQQVRATSFTKILLIVMPVMLGWLAGVSIAMMAFFYLSGNNTAFYTFTILLLFSGIAAHCLQLFYNRTMLNPPR